MKIDVHIPDGFLSMPVWATLDAAAAPAAAVAIRRARSTFDPARIPALGVMGAFVFAAQMINFPVGAGTSSHLVGGALLAYTLGPAAASVVMIAVLAIQALVFQDGGLLALGANIVNMAIIGVLAGYLPFAIWGSGGRRRAAIFAGGALSVAASAVLALSELLLSRVPMPRPMLAISLAIFAASALIEGAITLAVVEALDAMQPNFVRKPAERPLALAALAVTAVLLGAVGVLFASTAPDGIEHLTRIQAAGLPERWLGKTAAGLGGLALIYAVCLVIGRFAVRSRAAAGRSA
ncbi:MAG TPA: energy-coupling factor ABC transporter permease [Bryobacteraceae bacterium]|nr:energy-coupling factor ABC transporter permease [Bryobacteraceae bacterium]